MLIRMIISDTRKKINNNNATHIHYTPGLDGQCRRILQKSQRTGKANGLWSDGTVYQAACAQAHMHTSHAGEVQKKHTGSKMHAANITHTPKHKHSRGEANITCCQVQLLSSTVNTSTIKLNYV